MEEDAEKYLFEKMPVPKAVATLTRRFKQYSGTKVTEWKTNLALERMVWCTRLLASRMVSLRRSR